MNNLRKNDPRLCKRVCLSILLLMFMLNTIGCEPLRKKFTRKKKGKEEQFVPVLDPIDYDTLTVNIERIYRYHYALWLVWHKELMIAILEDASTKRQRHFLNESIAQLEEMQKMLIEPKQGRLGKILQDLRDVNEDLTKPLIMRNTVRMENDLKSISRRIRYEFEFDDVTGSLINPNQ